MTLSPSTSSSNMDQERISSVTNRLENQRPMLPPISSIDSFFTSRSWPPPSTSITSNQLVSPGSNGSCISMQESAISPTTARNNNEPWSPIPNKPKDLHPHNQPRPDYFATSAAGSSSTALSADSSSPSSSASPMDRDDIRYQNSFKNDYTSNRDHHFRQSSLPQINTLRKNSINNMLSQQHPSPPYINQQQQSVFRCHASNSGNTLSSTSHSSSSKNTTNMQYPAVSHSNSNYIPSTLKHIEKDIEEVIRHCNSLSDNMNMKKGPIMENENYFSNSILMRPWLDDMISRANEVLNALLRLRKHQLAAEYARLHGVSDHQHIRRGTEGQDNESWDHSSHTTIASTSGGTLSLNSKRPSFQGRCHSCNISETPEWRRGPDGARTLCNACGLHYAKLAKKKVKEEGSMNKEIMKEDRDDTSMK